MGDLILFLKNTNRVEIIPDVDDEVLREFIAYVLEKYGKITPEILGREVDKALKLYLKKHSLQ